MITQDDFTPELKAQYRPLNRAKSIEFFILKRGAHYDDIEALLRDWQEYSQHDIRDDWHYNGIHVSCRTKGANRGDGTYRNCPKAGTVERMHGHSFEGYLPCGCDDFRIG